MEPPPRVVVRGEVTHRVSPDHATLTVTATGRDRPRPAATGTGTVRWRS